MGVGEAKSRFEHDDLMERGRALIEESINFGVTHMRCFTEVDFGVGMVCLEAGLDLKQEFANRCYIQVCVFAQDPIFSYENKDMTSMLSKALSKPGVEVLGSTPYVEKGQEALVRNIEWIVGTALKYQLHLDFHIDYNLDPQKEPTIWFALDSLRRNEWPSRPSSKALRTIIFGHCTRLTLFDDESWRKLKQAIGDLPVSFVGLPTSDLFMIGRPNKNTGGSNRARGTLQVLEMIEKYEFNAAIGINNVGNAFTPQGNCDPLSLASLGVGIYQGGTTQNAEVIFVCTNSGINSSLTDSGL